MFDWIVDNLLLIGLTLIIFVIVRRIFFRSYSNERAVENQPSEAKMCHKDLSYSMSYSINAKKKKSNFETVNGYTKQENVEFAVFAPKSIVSDSIFTLDVWAYLPFQYEIVLEFAEELQRNALLGKKHGLEIERGSILLIAVEIEVLEVSDPVETLVWNGTPINVSYNVTVPINLQLGQYSGKVKITYEGMVICKIPFILDVGDIENKNYRKKSNDAFYPKTAFASYSSENRDEVLSRIHGMKKVAPNLDVFFDIFSLRSGQDWKKKLDEHVPTKDVFYLFWSQHAANSEWVGREWRLALSKRGLDYIEPVPLDDIDQAPPPTELKSLHFNDTYVAYIQYERLKRLQMTRQQDARVDKKR